MVEKESTVVKIDWQTPRLPREAMRTLNKKNDVAAWASLILRISLQLLLLGCALYLLESGLIPWAVPFVLANGALWFFLGWAGIGHELFHGTVFTNKKVNRLLFRFFSMLSWSNFGYFEYSHWRHHQVTLYPDDPELPSETRLSVRNVFWYLTIDVRDFWRKLRIVILNSLGVVPIPSRIKLPPNEQQRLTIINSARIVLVSQLLLFFVFAVWQPVLILLVTLAPFTCTLVGRILESAQHVGMQRSVNDFRRNTRTVVVAKPLAAAYANMNYHLEHHMYPSIPYYNLPKVRRMAPLEREFWPSPTVGIRAAARLAFGRAGG